MKHGESVSRTLVVSADVISPSDWLNIRHRGVYLDSCMTEKTVAIFGIARPPRNFHMQAYRLTLTRTQRNPRHHLGERVVYLRTWLRSGHVAISDGCAFPRNEILACIRGFRELFGFVPEGDQPVRVIARAVRVPVRRKKRGAAA